MPSDSIRYLVFDIESIADGELISRVKYPGENLSSKEAVDAYCAEQLERFNTEFIPYTYHIPTAISVAKVDHNLELQDIVTLDAPVYRPHQITKDFWQGWKGYGFPTLVSFNGRTFDIPLLELSAYRFGVGIPDWFNNEAVYASDKNRNRFNQKAHLDLQEVLTNFGATRLTGGLNLAANLLGKPGKMGIAGHMVQDLYEKGEIEQINDYCRCDVLDTYFVMLRTKVLTGDISLSRERELVNLAHHWLEEQAVEHPVYTEYLENCRQWANPWENAEV